MKHLESEASRIRRSIPILVAFFCFVICLSSSPVRAADGVAAVISTDGALIYTSPNEESPVLGQLPLGQAVRVSSGTSGSPQRFHKIRIGNKIGYVDALDVSLSAGAGGRVSPTAQPGGQSAGQSPGQSNAPGLPPAGAKAQAAGSVNSANRAGGGSEAASPDPEAQSTQPANKRGKKVAPKTAENDGVESEDAQSSQEEPKTVKKKKKKKKVAGKKNQNEPKMSIFETRYIGIEGGAQDYQEGIVGVGASTTLAVYGLKFTGPDLILKGPVLDINLLLHYGAPPYYNSLSSIQPNGFIFFFDTMLVLPLVNKQDFMFYIAGGPLLVYSKFGLVNSNRLMDLQALNLGIDGAAGIGFRIGKIAIKIEAKYYVEKQSYKAFLGALQTTY